MKNILYLFTFLISAVAFSQDLSIQMNYNKSYISRMYLKDNNYVFELGRTGFISSIYIFDSSSDASMYMRNPETFYRPRFKVKAGRVSVYVSDINNVEYCRNYSTYVRAGVDGNVCSINGVKINYYLKVGDNSRIGIVGKIKRIGNTTIKYHKNYSINVRNKTMGKLEAIGSKRFSYHAPTSVNITSGYAYNYKSIAGINFDYYKSYSGNVNQGFEGKIERLGNIRFYYHKSYSNRPKENIGKFKKKEGTDRRIFIF